MSSETRVYQNVDNGRLMNTDIYNAPGVDHELQKDITMLMHRLVMDHGTMTLAEMGYLHMNMVSYVEDHLEVKIYFLPQLATRPVREINGSKKDVPVEGLDCFKDYMFVGPVEQSITYDTLSVPKYKLIVNQCGNAEIRMKDSKKSMEDVEVLVLHCNLDLTIASMLNLDLLCSNLKIEYDTVGAIDGKSNAAGIMIIGTKREFPVKLIISYEIPNNDSTGYQTQDAIPYLLSKIREMHEAKAGQKKLTQKVSEKAANLKKKQTKKRFGLYLKYR